LEFLRAQIHHTDELVSFRLDTFRNDLLIADVTLAIVMISLTVGTYVTGAPLPPSPPARAPTLNPHPALLALCSPGIFGMNLDNGIADQPPLLFWLLNLGLLVVMVLIFFLLSSRFNITGAVPVTTTKQREQEKGWIW
jgi:hypothetical protein